MNKDMLSVGQMVEFRTPELRGYGYVSRLPRKDNSGYYYLIDRIGNIPKISFSTIPWAAQIYALECELTPITDEEHQALIILANL